MKEKTFKTLKLIPFIIGTILVAFGVFSKQYPLAWLGAFEIVAISLIFMTAGKIDNRYRVLFQDIFMIAVIGGGILFGFLARGTLEPRAGAEVWNIHDIDNPGYLIPNGLDPADANGDGQDDYVTNYEWDGKMRVAFYPDSGNINDEWPATTIGSIENAENAVFGDFDGDGDPDVVVAHGEELGAQSGVFFIWNPGGSDAEDGKNWAQSVDIDSTIGQGHFHCVSGKDIDEDGNLDVVLGGRGVDPQAGLNWIEAPSEEADRSDPSKWMLHEIDSDLESGHGFIFGDIDNDGDDDIAICNSDWDTADSEEAVIWYENPGAGIPAQQDEWIKHTIYQGEEFYSKEQVTLYDFTGDGYPEIVMQIVGYIYYFENPGAGGGDEDWTLTKIEKPNGIEWRGRTITIGDINNDGKQDIIGALMHKNGYFPKRLSAVWWMEYSGMDPKTAEWTLHTIKYADGFFGLGKWNGEKWDQMHLRDVDADGDIDIVANVEEFHSLGFCYMAVVWFENPLL